MSKSKIGYTSNNVYSATIRRYDDQFEKEIDDTSQKPKIYVGRSLL